MHATPPELYLDVIFLPLSKTSSSQLNIKSFKIKCITLFGGFKIMRIIFHSILKTFLNQTFFIPSEKLKHTRGQQKIIWVHRYSHEAMPTRCLEEKFHAFLIGRSGIKLQTIFYSSQTLSMTIRCLIYGKSSFIIHKMRRKKKFFFLRASWFLNHLKIFFLLISDLIVWTLTKCKASWECRISLSKKKLRLTTPQVKIAINKFRLI